MNERQLRYACGVWREKSFSRAAEKLRVSQPSLSDQVRLLEEEIGFPVFYRGARGIEPSANGVTFLERAEQILEGMARLEALGRKLRGGEQERIRIGFNTGIADHFIRSVGAAMAKAPRFRLEIATSTNRRIQRLIYQDKLDAGFLLGADMENWSQKLKTEGVAESDNVLVVPPGHALAAASPATMPATMAMIAAYPVAVSETEAGYGRAVIALFRAADVEPQIAADCDNVDSVKAMVAAGLAVAILPRVCVEVDLQAGRLVAVALAGPSATSVQLVRGMRPLPDPIEACLASIAQSAL